MRDARGLADGTRRGRLRIIERLLLSKFAGRPVIIGELRSENIRDFIAEQLKSLSTTSNAITIASALRAYLRYRASCGDAVQPLLAVISSPAHWSLASLPRSLKSEEVERLLSSFTATLPSPHRGYAVVRLALDLGLRSIEINQLQLDDIDWRLGTVTLKHTKSRRQYVLPLPTVTGQALEAYIRHERPQTRNRALFVRHLAPFDQPIGVAFDSQCDTRMAAAESRIGLCFVVAAKSYGAADDSQQRDATARSRGEGRQHHTSEIG